MAMTVHGKQLPKERAASAHGQSPRKHTEATKIERIYALLEQTMGLRRTIPLATRWTD
jgi:hypothetical protein